MLVMFAYCIGPDCFDPWIARQDFEVSYPKLRSKTSSTGALHATDYSNHEKSLVPDLDREDSTLVGEISSHDLTIPIRVVANVAAGRLGVLPFFLHVLLRWGVMMLFGDMSTQCM